MSRFENYTSTSENYDLTRRPAGLELILGALASGSRPLSEQVLLDAGCGTGNYAAALTGKVGRLECVELNPGMLATAQAKLAGDPTVRLQEGSIVELRLHGVTVSAERRRSARLNNSSVSGVTSQRSPSAACRRPRRRMVSSCVGPSSPRRSVTASQISCVLRSPSINPTSACALGERR